MKTSIYIGPSIRNGLLRQNTVFKDGQIPRHLRQLFDGSPALRGLVVPVGELAEAKIAMKKKGTIFNTFASKVYKEL